MTREEVKKAMAYKYSFVELIDYRKSAGFRNNYVRFLRQPEGDWMLQIRDRQDEDYCTYIKNPYREFVESRERYTTDDIISLMAATNDKRDFFWEFVPERRQNNE